MFKLSPPLNRVCQIEVAGEWVDPQTFLQYDFSAKVIVSRNFEVESVDFLSIDVYDADEPIDSDVAYILANNEVIKERLEEVAGNKAIAKAHAVDFEREVGND